MSGKSNRRDLLKTGTLAGVGYWVASGSAQAKSKSPNEKLNIACIGVGGMGSGDTDSVSSQNIVGICDVDENALNAKAEKLPDAKKYVDFRRMIDELDDKIDAVTVSTPDHTHFYAAQYAIKRGKHAFVQKPLTHDIWEARELTQLARKYKVCTQMGNQGTSGSGLREAVEVVWSGGIGPVREVHVWTNRPVWPQGVGALLRIPGVHAALHGGSASAPAVPKHLHWDLWLGTAPERAYYPDVYHNFRWRGWWDFGTGALGDMACHTANMAFMACKLGYPTSVQARVSEFNPETFPMWSVIEYEFPARGEMPPLKWTWYDGASDKPKWVNEKLKELAHGNDIPGSGSLLIGDDGTLFSPNDYGGEYTLLPKDKYNGYKPPAQVLARSPGHKEEWFQAIREGKPELALSNFDYAGPFTETVLLGTAACRFPEQKLEWDGPNLRFSNHDDANKHVKRQYREGWEI